MKTMKDIAFAALLLVAVTFGFAAAQVGCDGCGDELGPKGPGGPGLLDAGAQPLDGGMVEPEVQVTEAEVATTFVEHAGKRLRVVGVANATDDAVTDTPQGRGVSKASDTIDVSALQCHVVLKAPARPRGEENEAGNAWRGRQPRMHGLEQYLGVASWPVEFPAVTGCVTHWSALFKGQACLDVLASDFYVGSTIQDFLALPAKDQKCILKTRGRCEGDEGPVDCTVPVGDARAVLGARVFVPHGWVGRGDLNFKGATGASHEPEDRYVVPREAEAGEIERVR